jgi:F-type H+-transporting ATPase subunit delta
MSRAPVARRYAKALLEIGVERGTVDAMRDQLDALARAFTTSKEFRDIMFNPSIKMSERKQVMSQITSRYGFGPMLTNFLQLLLDKDRLRYVADISEVFGQFADVRAGRVRAHVTSATRLDLIQQTKIKEQILAITGARSIELETQVDASLIGGVVTRVGGMVLDGSVRHQLEELRTSILQEV